MRKSRKNQKRMRKRMRKRMQKSRKRMNTTGGTLQTPPYLPDKLNKYISTMLKLNIPNTTIKNLTQSIRNTYNTETKVLSKGTTLYRSGFESDPLDFFKSKSGLLFFGLDAYISIWYALELWQRLKEDRYSISSTSDWFVYMHEYIVEEPIAYTYLPDISENPRDNPSLEICSHSACVHPQFIFHGQYGQMKEIGTELTLPYGSSFLTQIRHVKSYKINLIKLLEMQDSPSYFSVPFSMEDVLTPV